MLSWLAPILVFGLVVLVHELGHFIAAKWLGVYAPRFSIGFGPALWRRRRGETEYIIAALPLGGYVRMASREDEATAFLEGGSEAKAAAAGEGGGGAVEVKPKDWDPEAMIPFGPKPVPANRWFESKPLWARLIILSAGVTMNWVLAFGVYTGLYAGNGRPRIPPVVDSIVAGRPAERAGLLVGDSIVAVNGQEVTRWSEVTSRVAVSSGRELALDVDRQGQRVTIRVTPEASIDTNPETGRPRDIGRIGAAATARLERLTLVESAGAGWTETWARGASVVRVIGGLVTGQVSVTQLGGPIAIARISVVAARSGFETLFLLIAFLSINIAVLNLLPIPILDGGQILLHVAETIRGSAFSARTREYILRVGLVAIALLFALVMFNDLKGLVRVFFG